LRASSYDYHSSGVAIDNFGLKSYLTQFIILSEKPLISASQTLRFVQGDGFEIVSKKPQRRYDEGDGLFPTQ